MKVEGVKDNIESASSCLDALATAREVMQAAWKSKLEIASRDAADSRAVQQVAAFEAKTMVLLRVDSKLIEYDGVLESLKAPGAPHQNAEATCES